MEAEIKAEATTTEITKRGRKPKSEKKLDKEEKNSNIGIEIKAPYEKIMAEREKMFYRLSNERGEVNVKVDACGANLTYRSVSEFPKENARCLCKDPRHFLVKFTITE